VRRLTALVLIAGCANGAITVTSQTLARHAPELREHGRAVVEARVQDGEYHYDDTTFEVRSDQQVVVAAKRLRIDALLEHCPATAFELVDAVASHPECQLVHAPDRLTVGYRRYSEVTASGVGETALTIGALGGLIACTIECSSPYDKVSGGVLIAAGVVSLGVVLLAVALSSRKYDH
jgi:hypothetical protein